MKLININCGDKTDMRTTEFLKQYYQENKEHLQRFTYKGTDIKCTLLANNKGWCTVITDNEQIAQVWAGELVLA